MERLTHERVNGIKEGYWSAAKKEDLVQRLAQYENTGLNPEEIMDLAKMGGGAKVQTVRALQSGKKQRRAMRKVEPCIRRTE